MGERNLEKEIHRILQSSSKLREYNSMLRDKCIKQDENFDQERKGWDQERKGWDRDIKKWSKKLGGLVTENRNLQFENASKAISLVNSESEIAIKSKEITTLRSMKKILEGKLSSAQEDAFMSQGDSLKKESEIISLKSELTNTKNELASKVSELEHLKSKIISKPVITEGGEGQSPILSTIAEQMSLTSKNTQSGEQSSLSNSSRGITPLQSNNISAINKDINSLRPYLVRRKSMEEAKKIDDNIEASAKAHIPAYTRPLLQSNDPSGLDTSKRHDEISEPPKVDTENTTKVSDGISGAGMANISEINNGDKLDASIIPDTPPDVVHIKSEIISLKSELTNTKNELASKVSELEHLKSKIISKPVITEGGEGQSPILSTIAEQMSLTSKNTQSGEQSSLSNSSRGITPLQSNNISAINKDINSLRPYLVRRKSMEEAKKIDDNIEASAKAHIPAYTRPLLQSNDPSGLDTSKRHDEISEPPKVDTENTTKVSDGISGAGMANISEINNGDKLDASIIPDTPLDVVHISSDVPSNMPKSVAPYLAQWENSEASVKTHNTPSLIESHPQIPIRGIEAMRPSLEALPSPIVASGLMAPLSAYVFLALLVIVVIWFVVLRREWGIDCIVTHSFMVVGMRFREGKLSSAQEDAFMSQGDSLKKESEIISLKSELTNTKNELASKVSELEHLKSKIISKPVITEGGEGQSPILSTIAEQMSLTSKNTQSGEQSSLSNSSRGITPLQSNNISAINKDINSLRPYLVRRKSMEEAKKIDDNIEASAKAHIPAYTRPLLQSNDPSGLDTSKRHDEISEPPKVDTENTTKVSDGISGAGMANISEINNGDKLDASIIPDTPLDVVHISSDVPSNMPKSVAPYLAQWENSEASVKTHNTPSLIESHPQIPIRGIEAMRPSLEALPSPIVASGLMAPLSAYVFLALLVIVVIWFVVLRREWGIDCIVTHSFMVVGMRFRGGHKFKKSDIITLELEPSNTYDKNAIKVMIGGIHKAYVAKNENVCIGDLMGKYPNYRITAHGKRNYNQSASLILEYPWMVCGRCRDTLQASRDYDYSYW
ncbi:hypothetical protein Glove_74g147 [Diversispora epigaea]|uniref:Uncharacterized protein n=1 Tax=Diversispora epigaea TaxID=1348612 RepID=A0A397J979_9GLOM|nr:hypothetical protein Glove_74g147 [Diversispora epigaea]